MNRKERRQAEKGLGVRQKLNNSPVNALAPKVPMESLINKQLEKVLDRERLKASNDTMNLLASIFIIVLKELQGFDLENVQEVLKQVMEQMELCGKELVTIDEMFSLAKSYGLETHMDDEKMDEIASWMNQKILVFNELDKGVTEIEDLVKATGCTGRQASSFRWEYNTKKYGVVDVSKQSDVFKMLDGGLDKETICKRVEITSGSFDQYKYLWKKKRNEVTIDDLADALFVDGDNKQSNKLQQEKIVKGVELAIGLEKANIEGNKSKLDHIAEDGKMVKKQVEENKVEEVKVMEERKVFVPAGKKKELKITRTTAIDGEFGKYVGTNNVIDIAFDAHTMTLEKAQLLELIEELQAVAGEL